MQSILDFDNNFYSNNQLQLPDFEVDIDLYTIKYQEGLDDSSIEKLKPHTSGFRSIESLEGSDLFAYTLANENFVVASLDDSGNYKNGTLNQNIRSICWGSDSSLIIADNLNRIFIFKEKISDASFLPELIRVTGTSSRPIQDIYYDVETDRIYALQDSTISVWNNPRQVSDPNSNSPSNVINLGFRGTKLSNSIADRQLLVSSSSQGNLNGLKLETNEIYNVPFGSPLKEITGLSYSRSDSLLIILYTGSINSIQFLTLDTDQLNNVTVRSTELRTTQLSGPSFPVYYDQKLSYIVSNGPTSSLRIKDYRNRDVHYDYPSNNGSITTVNSLLNGRTITGFDNGELWVWDHSSVPFGRLASDTINFAEIEVIPININFEPLVEYDQTCVNSVRDSIYSITNLGTASIRIDSITLSSGEDFEIESLVYPIYIEQGSIFEFGLSFRPTLPEGPKEDLLNIYHQSGKSEVILTGTGLRPNINVFQEEFELGSASVGESIKFNRAVLRNISSEDLNISQILFDTEVIRIDNLNENIIEQGELFNLSLEMFSNRDTVIETLIYIYTDGNCSPIILEFKGTFQGFDFTTSISEIKAELICENNYSKTIALINNSKETLVIDTIIQSGKIRDIGLEIQPESFIPLNIEYDDILDRIKDTIFIYHPVTKDNRRVTTIPVDISYSPLEYTYTPKALIIQPVDENIADTLSFTIENNSQYDLVFPVKVEGSKFNIVGSLDTLSVFGNSSETINIRYEGGLRSSNNLGLLTFSDSCGTLNEIPISVKWDNNLGNIIFKTKSVPAPICPEDDLTIEAIIYNPSASPVTILDIDSDYDSFGIEYQKSKSTLMTSDTLELTVTLTDLTEMFNQSLALTIENNGSSPILNKQIDIDWSKFVYLRFPEEINLSSVSPLKDTTIKISIDNLGNNSISLQDISVDGFENLSNGFLPSGQSSNIELGLRTEPPLSQVDTELSVIYGGCTFENASRLTYQTTDDYFIKTDVSILQGEAKPYLDYDLIIQAENLFDIDLTEITEVVLDIDYDRESVFILDDIVVDDKIILSANEATDFLEERQLLVKASKGFSPKKDAYFAIAGASFDGDPFLGFTPDTVKYQLVDKPEFDSTRTVSLDSLEIKIPNLPFTEFPIQVTLNTPDDKPYSVELFNTNGEILLSRALRSQTNYSIELTEVLMNNGAYIFRVSDGRFVYQKHFTVIR
ncbi:MAG: hypothetical protein Kapaf2KO_13660 [Candidatus Kapaibacteriales bacterium]